MVCSLSYPKMRPIVLKTFRLFAVGFEDQCFLSFNLVKYFVQKTLSLSNLTSSKSRSNFDSSFGSLFSRETPRFGPRPPHIVTNIFCSKQKISY